MAELGVYENHVFEAGDNHISYSRLLPDGGKWHMEIEPDTMSMENGYCITIWTHDWDQEGNEDGETLLELTPGQARDVAARLIECAEKVEEGLMPSSSQEPQGVIERARKAALYAALSNARDQQDEYLRARFDILVDSPELQAEVKGLADAAVNAAVRVVLEYLKDAPSTVYEDDAYYVDCHEIDALLKELT